MTSLIALHVALSARLGLSGNRLAEIKPIPNQAYQGRTRATPIQSAHIYVTVLRDHPGQGGRPARFSPRRRHSGQSSGLWTTVRLTADRRPPTDSAPTGLRWAGSHSTACLLPESDRDAGDLGCGIQRFFSSACV